MGVRTSQSSQWYEDPLIRSQWAEYNTVFESTIPGGVVKILCGELIHSNNNFPILWACLIGTIVVLFLPGACLTPFTCSTWRVVAQKVIDGSGTGTVVNKPFGNYRPVISWLRAQTRPVHILVYT